jgi:hypothetical protein
MFSRQSSLFACGSKFLILLLPVFALSERKNWQQ